MSPVGNAFRERLRKFPSLVNCCTIDWFSEWPADALKSVASRFLHDVDMDTQASAGVGRGPQWQAATAARWTLAIRRGCCCCCGVGRLRL